MFEKLGGKGVVIALLRYQWDGACWSLASAWMGGFLLAGFVNFKNSMKRP